MTDHTTTPLTITPQAMKDASKALRALVREATGQDIAHSTVLNTLTRGLGLGPHFSGMLHHLATVAAALPAPAVAPAGTTAPTGQATGSFLFLIIPRDRAEDIEDLETSIGLGVVAQPRGGWSMEDAYPLCGYEDDLVVRLSSARSVEGLLGDGPVPSDKALIEAICAVDDLAFLLPYLERRDALAFLAPAVANDRLLSVDFRYTGTGQICTASVEESLWKAGMDAGVDGPTLLRAVGGECEIASDAFEVLDVRSDFGTLWNG